MLMGIIQQEIILGCFVKVISVLSIITAAHVHNTEKKWKSEVALSRNIQEILSPALLVLVVSASLS
jgi:hypothetical protein